MLGYGLILLAVLGAAFYGLFVHRRLRRNRLASQPFPIAWQHLLMDRMALYRRLPASARERVHQNTLLIMDEVNFYGCAGLTVTDSMKVLVAAHGGLLIAGLSMDYYHALRSILIYPGAYRASIELRDGPVMTQSEQDRLGESWEQGRVILSWDSLSREAADPESPSNVALHEFSHQLDQVDGAADGAPPLASGKAAAHWQAVFTDAWHRLQTRGQGEDGVIDNYGAQDPAEFFAVVTEAFFLTADGLRREEPELYDCLAQFYKLSPADWAAMQT